MKQEKKLLRVLLVLLLLVVSLGSVGISTSEANKNRALIDSLSCEVQVLRGAIEELRLQPKQDTIVFDVIVKPQTIKIYNTCTN